MRYILRTILFFVPILGIFLYFGNDLLICFENEQPSFLVNNEIQNAKRMPSKGKNFRTYSNVLSTLGRTHIHSQLRSVLIESYASLKDNDFIYGEMGYKNGGKFWPHKTHRNGLCVDFMTPTKDIQTHKPKALYLGFWNIWGYSLRFDNEGVYKDYMIDFEAIIEHIYALDSACKKNQMNIERVILDPPLLGLLKKEPSFSKISHVTFEVKRVWFPHDSHYHIDFSL